MPMNLPSLGIISAPQSLQRLASLELVHHQVSRWREEAEGTFIELPDLRGRDTSEQVSQFLARVGTLTHRAERDNDTQRLDHLENAINRSMAEVQREWARGQEDPDMICAAVISLMDRQSNPFLAARVARDFDSALSLELAESEARRDERNSHARAVGDRYLAERNRAQDIDSLRPDSQIPQTPAPEESPWRVYLVYAVSSAIIGCVLAYILSAFIGGGWGSMLLTWAILAGIIFLIPFVRRGKQLNSSEGESESREAEQPNILPAEFKRELCEHAEARLTRFFAQSEVDRLVGLRQAWVRFVVERECRDIDARLEQVCSWVDGQLDGAPEGFFNEILPGEILLYGRALSQLLVRNLLDRVGHEREQHGLTSALLPPHSAPWRERLAHSSAAEMGEELARAAAGMVGELNFSTTMQQVLRDPEGEVAAKTWLDRLLKEVMAASALIEGVTAQNSDVREVLNCGLPGGRSDLLVPDITKQFNCEVFESTIPNGLELMCVTRNVQLDELASTQHLQAAYEKFDPKVREIYFEFPSRGRVAENTSTDSVQHGPAPDPMISEESLDVPVEKGKS